MKKAASIFMAILVLLTGLHLSIASHFCGGKLAAVKVSINGMNATCGMEDESESSYPAGEFIKTHCCDNELTTLTVDSNYSPSFTQSIDLTQKVMPVFTIPVAEIITPQGISRYVLPIHSPPDVLLISSVDLATICVFRI
jgi:hypothetical protein